MGSDMSKPKNRRNPSADCALRNRAQSKSMVNCLEQNYPDTIRDYRRDFPCQYTRVCYQESIDPNNKNIIDPCSDPYRVSRCSTPVQVPYIPQNYYPDIGIDPKSCHQSRYRKTRPGECYREEDFYIDKTPRQYTIKKSYQPVVYDDCDKVISKLPADCEIIPADRIYEIRKEKVLIRTDRSSQSPPRIRSKSSDRYIEVPRAVRVVNTNNTGSIRHERPIVYNTTNDNLKSNLRSRSGYVINSDEYANYRSESSEHSSRINDSNKILNKSQLCINNDIIYVPMVREEFIKRESQKLKSDSDQSFDGSIRLTNEQHLRLKRPNKIIISELTPIEKVTSPIKTETSLKSILKNTENLELNNNSINNDNSSILNKTNLNNLSQDDSTKLDDKLKTNLVDQIKVNSNNRNGLIYEHYISSSPSPSPINEFKSKSCTNFKYGLDKDGNIYDLSDI